MPIYEYKCLGGHITTGWNKIADRHDSPSCVDCLGDTALIISASRSNPDWEPWQSEVVDHSGDHAERRERFPKYFRSRKHYLDELKARNLSIK